MEEPDVSSARDSRASPNMRAAPPAGRTEDPVARVGWSGGEGFTSALLGSSRGNEAEGGNIEKHPADRAYFLATCAAVAACWRFQAMAATALALATMSSLIFPSTNVMTRMSHPRIRASARSSG